MAHIFPQTATPRELQRSYRKLFDYVITSREPLVIMNNSQPEVVIIDIETFRNWAKQEEKKEDKMLRKAIAIYEKEKKEGKLKTMKSLKELL